MRQPPIRFDVRNFLLHGSGRSNRV
jgi:hypothetical protein